MRFGLEHGVIHKAEAAVLFGASLAGQGPKRLAYLDGWRGLAILCVVIGHFGGAYWQPLVVLGGFGVELFFVLSGRLMADILFVSRQPLSVFFRRRFARIVPALFVFATIMAATGAVVHALQGPLLLRHWEYFSAITFTINYVQALTGRGSPLLAHIWSLSVEEHCYVLLALVALALSRNAGRARWVLAALGAGALLNGIRLYMDGAGGVHEIYWRTDVRLAPVFLSGAVFLALRCWRPPSPVPTRLLSWLPLPCVVITASLFFVAPIPLTYSLSAALLAVAVNALDFSPPMFRRALSTRMPVTLGFLSYSIYLWQQPFYALNGTLSALALVPMVVAAGSASYYLVERPARRWLNGLPPSQALAASSE